MMWTRTRAVLAVLPLALLLALVGCGSGGGGSEVASADAGSTEDPPADGSSPGVDGESSSDPNQYVELAECLRDQGIDVQDPDVDDPEGFLEGLSDAERERLQDALDACEEYVPQEGAAPDNDPMDDPEAQEALLEWAGCMREHGVDLPDPDFAGDGYTIDPELMDDPDFEDANEACEPIVRDQFGEPHTEEGSDG